jgi:DNA-binding NarL/FixJ family response regulator
LAATAVILVTATGGRCEALHSWRQKMAGTVDEEIQSEFNREAGVMRETGVFSARGEQILRLLLAGLPTREIARDLDITVATVKAVLRQILCTVKARSETPRSIEA